MNFSWWLYPICLRAFYYAETARLNTSSSGEMSVSRLLMDSGRFLVLIPADRTVSKRPGTSYRIKIHFVFFNHLYLIFSFMKLVETL